jgi:hypothetical protein
MITSDESVLAIKDKLTECYTKAEGIEETTSDYDKEKLQERQAKLAGGVAVIKVGAATEVELKESDFAFLIDEDNSIDLTELVRQNLLTALPIKPLCSSLCEGLARQNKKKHRQSNHKQQSLSQEPDTKPT